MEFQADGAAALVTVPFPSIRQDPSSFRSLWGNGTLDRTDLGDLVSRLEEVVRCLRAQEGDRGRGAVLRFGPVEVEPATQTIRRTGQNVAVTRTEFRLLYALMRRPGQILSREELLGEVWGAGTRLRSRAIDTHIARLRRKLEADPAAPRYIRTAPYRGYCFNPHGG